MGRYGRPVLRDEGFGDLAALTVDGKKASDARKRPTGRVVSIIQASGKVRAQRATTVKITSSK